MKRLILDSSQVYKITWYRHYIDGFYPFVDIDVYADKIYQFRFFRWKPIQNYHRVYSYLDYPFDYLQMKKEQSGEFFDYQKDSILRSLLDWQEFTLINKIDYCKENENRIDQRS